MKHSSNMNSFVRVLPTSPTSSAPIRVGWIGAWKQRRHRTHRYCEHVYLMWITRGQGDLIIDDRSYEVVAPCLVVTTPGTHLDYGPVKSWDEHFAICEPKAVDLLPTNILQQPVLPLMPSPLLRNVLQSWFEPDFAQPSDDRRIDSLIHFALLESLRCRPTPLDPLLHHLHRVQARIDAHPEQPYDPEQDAREAGVSRSTWERAWKTHVGCPPARYHLQRRLETAARLLETKPSASIRNIALEVGYDDPLHFSRRFRRWCGHSPKAYRQQRSH